MGRLGDDGCSRRRSHAFGRIDNRPATQLPTASATSSQPATLTVMMHDYSLPAKDVIAAFEQANNVKSSFLKSGDAGAALNRAILSKATPLADVFYGVDNTFLSRALDADIYEP